MWRVFWKFSRRRSTFLKRKAPLCFHKTQKKKKNREINFDGRKYVII